jgi:hypothetical protein
MKLALNGGWRVGELFEVENLFVGSSSCPKILSLDQSKAKLARSGSDLRRSPFLAINGTSDSGTLKCAEIEKISWRSKCLVIGTVKMYFSLHMLTSCSSTVAQKHCETRQLQEGKMSGKVLSKVEPFSFETV